MSRQNTFSNGWIAIVPVIYSIMIFQALFLFGHTTQKIITSSNYESNSRSSYAQVYLLNSGHTSKCILPDIVV
jgi:hypothetical protein